MTEAHPDVFKVGQDEVEFLTASVPGWAGKQESDLSFKRIAFGGSRDCFVVTAPGATPEKVMLRRSTKRNPDKTAKERELYVFQKLGALGIGPVQYADNDSFHAEEYIESVHPTARSLNEPLVRRQLAVQLGVLHSIPVTDAFQYFLDRRMSGWMISAFTANVEKEIVVPEKKERYESLKAILPDREAIIARARAYPQVLSHNDLWVGNTLQTTTEPKRLLYCDFECVDLCFAGFDIGKMLLESVFDRPRPHSPYHEVRDEDFPTPEQQREFVRYYLAARRADPQELPALLNDVSGEGLAGVVASHFGGEDIEALVTAMMPEVHFGIAASAYQCPLLGAALGKDFPSEMDFEQFAADNLKYYLRFKD